MKRQTAASLSHYFCVLYLAFVMSCAKEEAAEERELDKNNVTISIPDSETFISTNKKNTKALSLSVDGETKGYKVFSGQGLSLSDESEFTFDYTLCIPKSSFIEDDKSVVAIRNHEIYKTYSTIVSMKNSEPFYCFDSNLKNVVFYPSKSVPDLSNPETTSTPSVVSPDVAPTSPLPTTVVLTTVSTAENATTTVQALDVLAIQKSECESAGYLWQMDKCMVPFTVISAQSQCAAPSTWKDGKCYAPPSPVDMIAAQKFACESITGNIWDAYAGTHGKCLAPTTVVTPEEQCVAPNSWLDGACLAPASPVDLAAAQKAGCEAIAGNLWIPNSSSSTSTDTNNSGDDESFGTCQAPITVITAQEQCVAPNLWNNNKCLAPSQVESARQQCDNLAAQGYTWVDEKCKEPNDIMVNISDICTGTELAEAGYVWRDPDCLAPQYQNTFATCETAGASWDGVLSRCVKARNDKLTLMNTANCVEANGANGSRFTFSETSLSCVDLTVGCRTFLNNQSALWNTAKFMCEVPPTFASLSNGANNLYVTKPSPQNGDVVAAVEGNLVYDSALMLWVWNGKYLIKDTNSKINASVSANLNFVKSFNADTANRFEVGGVNNNTFIKYTSTTTSTCFQSALFGSGSAYFISTDIGVANLNVNSLAKGTAAANCTNVGMRLPTLTDIATGSGSTWTIATAAFCHEGGNPNACFLSCRHESNASLFVGSYLASSGGATSAWTYSQSSQTNPPGGWTVYSTNGVNQGRIRCMIPQGEL